MSAQRGDIVHLPTHIKCVLLCTLLRSSCRTAFWCTSEACGISTLSCILSFKVTLKNIAVPQRLVFYHSIGTLPCNPPTLHMPPAPPSLIIWCFVTVPPLQDRILVFHRGIGSEKLSGLLIDQKLDLLMDYTVFNLLDKLRQPLEGLLAKVGLVKKKTEEEEKVGSWMSVFCGGAQLCCAQTCAQIATSTRPSAVGCALADQDLCQQAGSLWLYAAHVCASTLHNTCFIGVLAFPSACCVRHQELSRMHT
jgi:hypothetical protein